MRASRPLAEARTRRVQNEPRATPSAASRICRFDPSLGRGRISIKSVIDAPPLCVPDLKSGPHHRGKNPGEEKKKKKNEPKGLFYEGDAPDLA